MPINCLMVGLVSKPSSQDPSKLDEHWKMTLFLFFFFSSLQCPVLIAWGDKDPWEPIELGRNYGNFDSVEDFVVLPNVGHCPQVLSLSLSLSLTHTPADLHGYTYKQAHVEVLIS
jgi:hypothetical protein